LWLSQYPTGSGLELCVTVPVPYWCWSRAVTVPVSYWFWSRTVTVPVPYWFWSRAVTVPVPYWFWSRAVTDGSSTQYLVLELWRSQQQQVRTGPSVLSFPSISPLLSLFYMHLCVVVPLPPSLSTLYSSLYW
jgi:hypothetical protein